MNTAQVPFVAVTWYVPAGCCSMTTARQPNLETPYFARSLAMNVGSLPRSAAPCPSTFGETALLKSQLAKKFPAVRVFWPYGEVNQFLGGTFWISLTDYLS